MGETAGLKNVAVKPTNMGHLGAGEHNQDSLRDVQDQRLYKACLLWACWTKSRRSKSRAVLWAAPGALLSAGSEISLWVPWSCCITPAWGTAATLLLLERSAGRAEMRPRQLLATARAAALPEKLSFPFHFAIALQLNHRRNEILNQCVKQATLCAESTLWSWTVNLKCLQSKLELWKPWSVFKAITFGDTPDSNYTSLLVLSSRGKRMGPNKVLWKFTYSASPFQQ